MAKRRFSPTRKLNKRNIEKTPDKKPALYKIKNRKGDNVYTGVAQRGRVQERLQEHMPGGPDPIPGADSFSVKQKPSIGGAKGEEKRIIKDEQPKHNEQSR